MRQLRTIAQDSSNIHGTVQFKCIRSSSSCAKFLVLRLRSSKSFDGNLIVNGINDNFRWLKRRQRPLPSGEYPNLHRFLDSLLDGFSVDDPQLSCLVGSSFLSSNRFLILSLNIILSISPSLVEFSKLPVDELAKVSFVFSASTGRRISAFSAVEFVFVSLIEENVEFWEEESGVSETLICSDGTVSVVVVVLVVGLTIGFNVKSA